MKRALLRAILFIFIALQLNAPLVHAHVSSDGGIAGIHLHSDETFPDLHAQGSDSAYGNWDSSDRHVSPSIEVSRALPTEPLIAVAFIAVLLGIFGFVVCSPCTLRTFKSRLRFSFFSPPPAPIRAPPLL